MPSLLFCILLLLFPFRQESVLICKSGTAYAYHSYNCQGLRGCTHAIERISQIDAVRLGKKACGYCYKNKETAPSPLPASGGQCRAQTKSGRQCSRKGGSNEYCWQHG
jgi:hypothetical protein